VRRGQDRFQERIAVPRLPERTRDRRDRADAEAFADRLSGIFPHGIRSPVVVSGPLLFGAVAHPGLHFGPRHLAVHGQGRQSMSKHLAGDMNGIAILLGVALPLEDAGIVRVPGEKVAQLVAVHQGDYGM